MKKVWTVIVMGVVLVVLIVVGTISYRFLSKRYNLSEPEKLQEETDNNSSELSAESEELGDNESQEVSDEPDEAISTAADFQVLDAEGNTVSLSSYFGKPIVVNFWATWCGPCQSELPAFESAYQTYGSEVQFMMVNLTDGFSDTVSGVTDFVDKNGYSFPVYFDTEYSGSNAYSVSAIPVTIIIDKNGNVYTTHVGTIEQTMLEKYISEVMTH